MINMKLTRIEIMNRPDIKFLKENLIGTVMLKMFSDRSKENKAIIEDTLSVIVEELLLNKKINSPNITNELLTRVRTLKNINFNLNQEYLK